MSKDQKPTPFPPNVLIILGSVMLFSILVAGFGRAMGFSDSAPTAAPLSARELLFHDSPDGSILVYDAKDATAPIDVVAPATNGFLRATMRGLARQRLRQDADREVPFRLTRWADGRLTLEDPTTGRRGEMEAFGIDNEKIFSALLTAKAGS